MEKEIININGVEYVRKDEVEEQQKKEEVKKYNEEQIITYMKHIDQPVTVHMVAQEFQLLTREYKHIGATLARMARDEKIIKYKALINYKIKDTELSKEIKLFDLPERRRNAKIRRR